MNITVNNMKAIGSMIHSACAGSPAGRSKTGNGKALICYLLYFIFGISSLSLAQTNVLHIGEVTYPAGRTATIPVELENQSDIVGVQFEIVTPYVLKEYVDEDENTSLARLNSQRATNHEVSVALRDNSHSHNSELNIYYKRYRVIVHSAENTKLSGSSGTLLTLQLDLPETLETGTVLPVYFYEYKNTTSTSQRAEVILSDRQGQNIVSGFTNGSITIENVPRPDIVPSAVSVAQTLANPGDQIDLSWTVTNEGDLATGAGWSEKIFLENEQTRTRVYAGLTAYEGTLAPGASVTRTFSLNLDAYPGVGGQCRPVVQLVPSADCGEIALDQGNNTAAAASFSLRVTKSLVLTTYKNPIPENSNTSYACELRRTGDLSLSQTFNVTTIDANGNTGRLKVQSDGSGNVRFDKNVSKVNFYLYPIDNDDINMESQVTIVVNENQNNGYNKVEGTVTMEDDDLIPLTLTLNKTEYNEGDNMTVVASVPQHYYPGDIYVYLTIEQNKRFKLPQRIVIPAGQTSGTAVINVLQDNTPANQVSVKLTGTAEHHATAEKLFILNDDDTPAINMTLTPTTVSEGGGPSCIYGTITRSEVTNNKITIKLTDDGDGDIYYSQRTYTMPAGTTTINFSLGTLNNQMVDGDRVVNIRASVYVTDCNCDAIGDRQSSVTIPVTITDDDGPALTVTANPSVIMEGDQTGGTFTVSRNTTDNSSPVTVNISVGTGGVVYPATVTIPAEAASATGTISANANDEEEGDRTTTIVASASGYSPGTAWLLISDRTLPDMTFEYASLSTETANSGDSVVVTMRFKNVGAASMAAGIPVVLTENGRIIASAKTVEAIGKGESCDMAFRFLPKTIPGTYNYACVVNAYYEKAELLYVNNETPTMPLTVTSNYSYTISVPKAVFTENEEIRLSGTVSAAPGVRTDSVQVEAYVIFQGVRTPFKVRSDANSRFEVVYERPAAYHGTFSYGVCDPDEGLTTAAGTFDVCGFARTSKDYIKHELFKAEPYVGTIELKNLTSHTLHNIQPTLSGATDNYDIEVSSISELPGNGTAVLNYTITGREASDGVEWEQILVHLTTDEEATLDITLYNYTRLHTPKLVASTTSINTTVTKGNVRTYPVKITNTGMAETGRINVDLPTGFGDFITLATPKDMPSLAPGDTADVLLRFNPLDFDVNVIQKGNFVIHSEDGNSVAVYFNVKVVSESKGALRVQVRDENTIYGNKDGEKPYVAGATVELKDLNTGVTVVSGTTPDNTDAGILFENVPEGYYQLYVTAAKHDSYRQNVLISPGETTTHLATISYQAISVSWDVVETEVEDEYEIVTTLTYETMVPVPVVRMTLPETLGLDLLDYGHANIMNIVLRNDGLISAQNLNVHIPEVDGFTFTPLVPYEGLTLAAEQSMIIPVRITRNEVEEEEVEGPNGIRRRVRRKAPDNGGIPCNVEVAADYEWPCGEDSKFGFIQDLVNAWAEGEHSCSHGNTGIPGSWPTDPSGPGRPGRPVPTYPDDGGPGGGKATSPSVATLCAILECLPWDIPYKDCAMSGFHAARGNGKKALSSLGSCIVGMIPGISTAVSLYNCFKAMGGAMGFAPQRRNAKGSDPMPDLLQAYANKLAPYVIDIEAFFDLFHEVYGCDTLLNVEKETELMDLSLYLDAFVGVDSILMKMENEGTILDIDLTKIRDMYDLFTSTDPYGFAQCFRNTGTAIWGGGGIVMQSPKRRNAVVNTIPHHYVTTHYRDLSLKRYVERRMNYFRVENGQQPTNDNCIHDERVEELFNRNDSCLQVMVDMGFVDWEELVMSANKDKTDYYEGKSGNTCAKVKLEIEQKLVLTRQAFRGTLTIENETAQNLTDIDLSVTATNLLGEQATSHEFQINFESIDGFEGSIDGPWTLGPRSKGVATILFIPTKYAAPDNVTTWSFGGSLSLTDGDGETQVRSLYPVSLEVKPSPELDLTYFMQRDIYGDNPLTKEVVEPTIPAEFSVLIHNKGKGDATNIRMFTKQPKIVENEKGLLVDFAIVSSSLNGGEKSMALDSLIATQFGDIAAGGSSYATWDLTSSLLGHFIDYDIRVNHVTSYGNPDLSLLDQVTIHELIHSVNVKFGDEQYRGWVCNDFEDGHAEPDRIYFSNGTDEAMKTLTDITTVTPLGDSKWRVSVTIPQKEWFYTSVADPTGGIAQILSLKNEDTNEELDPQNFWKTQYTMQDGFDPLPENKLHIVAYADGPQTMNFIVEYEPVPDLRLDVVSIQTVPNEDDIAEDPITQLTVTFNKPIDPLTFTRDDIVLRYEGEKQTTALPITQPTETDSTVFHLNTSALSENGYYVLQVKTDNIRDNEGFFGYNGLQVTWMLYKDGLVHYNVGPWPSAAAGTVVVSVNDSPGSTAGDASFGSTLTVTATPKYGYRFVGWALTHSATSGGASGMPARRSPGSGESTIPESQLETFSTDPQITVEMNQTQNLVAMFKPEQFRVSVDCDRDAGTINLGTGYYDYGTVVNLEAAANDGYQLLGFVINGSPVDCQNGQYEYTVQGNDNIEVRFKNLSPQSILLQDTKDYVPAEVELANVKLQRSFRKGTWNTICLPCGVYKPEEVFGTGTLLARLTGVENNVMQFSYVNVMEANIPYLIKPGDLNSSSLADGQTKTSFFDILGTSVVEPAAGGPIDDTEQGVQFIGSYVAEQVPGRAGYYYISSDQLYYVDDAANVPSGRFRGYFHADGDNLVKRMGISFGGDIPTLYVDMPVSLNADIYSLDGVLVRKASEGTARGLKPGIYIMGGQKVRVK